VDSAAQCVTCGRSCGWGDLRCETCPGGAHRRCLSVAAHTYPGGWFRCGGCVLAAAGVGEWNSSGKAGELARSWVALAGSAVGDRSASTYESSRRRFLRFCVEELRLPVEAAFPRRREADLNPQLVCLFIVHSAQEVALSTLGGTLSALADWQRSRGLPAEASISRHPMVRRTLMQVARGHADAGRPTAPREKAPLPVGMLRLLVGWLRQQSLSDPAQEPAYTQDACWLAFGFFGMLRRSELAGLSVGDVKLLAGGGVELIIRRSKTDQRGAGASVVLAALSASGVPIERIARRHLAWVQERGANALAPLFVRGLVWPRSRAPRWELGDFTKRLRTLIGGLQQQGIVGAVDVSRLTAHSLRRGGATAAATAGVSIEAIKAHGRWRSDAVAVYIRKSVGARLNVVQSM
jgi:integrase